MTKRNIFRFLDFTSPPIIYSIIWIFLIFLYKLKIINYYLDLDKLTVITLVSIIFSFYVAWILIRLKYPIRAKKKFEKYPPNFEELLVRLINKSNKIWIIGVLMTIILQKGFPLYWMLAGLSKGYTDFGLPSIHGFLTSFWLFSLLSSYILFLRYNNKKYLIKVLLLFIFPIISINRGALMLGLMELLAAYLFYNKISIVKISKIVISLVFILYLFGVIGDFRVGYKLDFMNNMVSDNYKELFVEKLPSGFTWSYLYFTASLDNLNGSIHNFNPNYIPNRSVVTLFPTVIRELIWTDKNYDTRYDLKMTNPVINTFTYLSGFLVDFGIAGTILIYFFIQLFQIKIYIKARNGTISSQLMYMPILATIFLSPFANYLFTLVIIFQIILGKYTGNYLKKHGNKAKTLLNV